MLHGGLSTIDMFFAILPALAQTRQVIAVEQQGHGHTADIDRPFSFAQMADDTAALLEQVEIESADVFGYSAGGSVALQLAVRHPRRVCKLALASTIYHPDGYLPGIGQGQQHATPEGLPPVMREAYERAAPNPAGWPALVARAAEQARSPGGMRPDDVQSIQAPALVIVADGDIIVPEHSEALARLLRAELVVLPNSDHVSYIVGQPALLLAKLTAFLDAPAPQRSSR